MNDTTTLDAAVDSLLAPQGESPEVISEETVDEMIEQPVDEQDEVIEELWRTKRSSRHPTMNMKRMQLNILTR